MIAPGPVSAGWVTNCREQLPVTAVERWLNGLSSRNAAPVKLAPVFAAADQTFPAPGEHAATAVTLTVNDFKNERLRFRSLTVFPTTVAVPFEVRTLVIE